jgi:hypothetical protein
LNNSSVRARADSICRSSPLLTADVATQYQTNT